MDNSGIMPVMDMNSGFGGGNSFIWIFGLLILMGMFNGGFGGFGGAGNMMLGYDFPWLLNGQQGINANTNAGFSDAMLNDGITSFRLYFNRVLKKYLQKYKKNC